MSNSDFPFSGNRNTILLDTIKKPLIHGSLPTSYLGMQPDWEITDNGRGLLEGNAKFVFEHANEGKDNDIPRMGTPHPADSRLFCWDVSTSYGKSLIGYATAKYIGISNGNMTLPEFTLSGNASEQSVKFHPKFSEWETEAANDVQKIKRDDNGYFVSFGPKHPKVPAIEQFVAPTGTCKVSFYCKSTATWSQFMFGGLGKQADTPSFGPNYLNASAMSLSWLLTGVSVSEHGTIFKVELDFTLSVLGKKHNEYMYEKLGVSGGNAV
jgi:hypothetical protein